MILSRARLRNASNVSHGAQDLAALSSLFACVLYSSLAFNNSSPAALAWVYWMRRPPASNRAEASSPVTRAVVAEYG